MHGSDVGMIELREQQRFLAKTLACIRLDLGRRRKDFEGDVAIKALVVGAIDNTHASGPDLLKNTVMGKRGLHGDSWPRLSTRSPWPVAIIRSPRL